MGIEIGEETKTFIIFKDSPVKERDQARKKLAEPKEVNAVRAVFDGGYIKFVNYNHMELIKEYND